LGPTGIEALAWESSGRGRSYSQVFVMKGIANAGRANRDTEGEWCVTFVTVYLELKAVQQQNFWGR